MPRQQAAGHDATPPMISRKASKAYGAGHNLRHYVKTTRFQDAVADISDNARAAYVLKDQGELWRTCWCACGAALAGAIAEVGYLDMHGDGAGCGGALWSILGGRPLDVGPEVSGRGNCCQGWVVPNCGDVRCFRLCLQLVMRVSSITMVVKLWAEGRFVLSASYENKTKFQGPRETRPEVYRQACFMLKTTVEFDQVTNQITGE
ncbi:hypothetical protein HPP92_024470 [Vanilla planifolia]|uniref:Uncharacterized protein n=1 Tax=Vanilla planifolia TaxID=51239 RepID=A0A835PPV0_VANPL|nr:hypothetical protein HPP92_024470 [Vanilla planifolia]